MQQDYIMRVIEQLVQAIVAIMQRRKAGEYKEARQQIYTTTRYLLRIDLDLLLLYEDDYILDHFKDFTRQFETEKCVLGADLLYELALIEEGEKQSEKALRLKELCLHLYAIGLPKEDQFQESQHFEKLSTLIAEVRNQPLSEKQLANLCICEDLVKSNGQKKINSKN